MKPVEATLEGRGVRRGPYVLLEPPAHNTGCCVIGLTYSSGTFVSFFVFTAGCKASGPPGPPLHPPYNPWNIQLSQGTGQGVSMTFNAVARGQKCGAGSSRCKLPIMHSVPKSAVLPYASGVGGLSRRLLNTAESRDRTGSQHDIQCSEPAAVARGQKCGAGVKSLQTAAYA